MGSAIHLKPQYDSLLVIDNKGLKQWLRIVTMIYIALLCYPNSDKNMCHAFLLSASLMGGISFRGAIDSIRVDLLSLGLICIVLYELLNYSQSIY